MGVERCDPSDRPLEPTHRSVLLPGLAPGALVADDGAVSQTRTHLASAFDLNELVAAKGSTSVSVCIPARNEEPTVGEIVQRIRTELIKAHALVDEIVVVDDHSTDRTAKEASAAGATVVDASQVLVEFGRGHGKGEALWKSLFASSGDIVVWCDADVRDFSTRFISGLLGPLLTDPSIGFVKGFYERPVDGHVRGGGRVTELVARPLLTMCFPELGEIVQPLSGEYGGRREVLERLPFVEGYGVDIAMLIDIVQQFGAETIAQVDLGERIHRNRPLHELSPMAAQVMQAALRRIQPDLVPDSFILSPPDLEAHDITYAERPALATIDSYRAKHTRLES